MEKIVIFSAFYDPFISGAERMVKEVVERLENRYCFIIVTARLDQRLTTYEKRQKNIEIRRIGFGFKFDKYLYPILAPFYALKYQPKVVHAVMESYAGIALLVYSHISKILKFLIHNPSFLILTLQSGDLDLPAKQQSIPKWLWKCIHRAPDLVVSIGNSMAERARTLRAKNVKVIPNGVDLYAVHGFDNVKKVPHKIVCVARLSPEKGIEYLIEAMPGIVKEYQDAKLVLVGDGVLQDELKAKSQKLKVFDAIKFLGNLPHDEALLEIASSDVLILPSLAEGMGIVLVEAQAIGVPVIGSNVGGIPDVIEHEKTGLLALPGNSQEIIKAVKRIFDEPDLSRKMSMEAKERLWNFDWKNISEQYAAIYNSKFSTQGAGLERPEPLGGDRLQNSKLSVLIATGIYPPDIGGPATYSEKLAKELTKRGNEVKVITYADKSEKHK